MSANDLIKTLFKQKYEIFVKLIDLINISKKLIMKKNWKKKNQLMISINQKKSIIFFDSKMKIRKTKFW